MKGLYWLPCLLIVVVMACDEEENNGALSVSDRQQQLDRLTRTWRMDQVVYEGFDVTEDFVGLTVTFMDDNTWSTTDGAPTFGSNGTWQLDEENLNQLLLNDTETLVTISPDVRVLRLEFVLTGGRIGSRTRGLDGEYVMSFSTEAEEN